MQWNLYLAPEMVVGVRLIQASNTEYTGLFDRKNGRNA